MNIFSIRLCVFVPYCQYCVRFYSVFIWKNKHFICATVVLSGRLGFEIPSDKNIKEHHVWSLLGWHIISSCIFSCWIENSCTKKLLCNRFFVQIRAPRICETMQPNRFQPSPTNKQANLKKKTFDFIIILDIIVTCILAFEQNVCIY